MIFAGPVGVGKMTTARALATLFLCENPRENSPCGTCPSCILMGVLGTHDSTNHPDFHVVYRQLIRLEKDTSKARDLSVRVIRDYIIVPAGLKPMMNRGKVFVLEEADLMNAATQNALLKTLEEPPPRTLVILLTDQPATLLPTVRSRCQTIPFATLDTALVARELEHRQIAKSLAAEAARLSDGSLGVALRWIEDGVVTTARELTPRLDSALAGEGTDLPDFLKKSAEAYAEKQLVRDNYASKDQATKEGLFLYFKLSADHFRQRLTHAADEDQLEHLCSAIDALARAENYLDSNVNIPLVLQQLTVTLGRTTLV
jgi:DNA polymerase-3 subunit delta'